MQPWRDRDTTAASAAAEGEDGRRRRNAPRKPVAAPLGELAGAVGELSSRAVWFSFLHAVLFLLLYLVGNFQEFLDQTQLVLLRLFEAAAALTVAFGVAGTVYLGYQALVIGAPRVLRLTGTVLVAIGSGLLLLLFKFLRVWFQL